MRPSNRLNLNYQEEAKKFSSIPGGIIDIHSHIQGAVAAKLYASAADHYGINLTYSMTPVHDLETVRRNLGERIRFIAIPTFGTGDPVAAFGRDFIRDLPIFKSYGAKIAKIWNAPRIYDSSNEPFVSNQFRIDSSLRIDAMKAAVDHGMIFMAHVADPDTWFATKYRDSKKYGTKREQYDVFESVLDRFNTPWIAAHMGGYPEDINFLSELLARHSNLYLDCSATKWIVRELSKHDPQRVREFFNRWRGRLLFGSDIVARESHVSEAQNTTEMDSKAGNADEAYDLYASRYWALRTLLETSYHDESPIADPDLHMSNSDKHTPLDAPALRGCALEGDALHDLYRNTALAVVPE